MRVGCTCQQQSPWTGGSKQFGRSGAARREFGEPLIVVNLPATDCDLKDKCESAQLDTVDYARRHDQNSRRYCETSFHTGIFVGKFHGESGRVNLHYTMVNMTILLRSFMGDGKLKRIRRKGEEFLVDNIVALARELPFVPVPGRLVKRRLNGFGD